MEITDYFGDFVDPKVDIRHKILGLYGVTAFDKLSISDLKFIYLTHHCDSPLRDYPVKQRRKIALELLKYNFAPDHKKYMSGNYHWTLQEAEKEMRKQKNLELKQIFNTSLPFIANSLKLAMTATEAELKTIEGKERYIERLNKALSAMQKVEAMGGIKPYKAEKEEPSKVEPDISIEQIVLNRQKKS